MASENAEHDSNITLYGILNWNSLFTLKPFETTVMWKCQHITGPCLLEIRESSFKGKGSSHPKSSAWNKTHAFQAFQCWYYLQFWNKTLWLFSKFVNNKKVPHCSKALSSKGILARVAYLRPSLSIQNFLHSVLSHQYFLQLWAEDTWWIMWKCLNAKLLYLLF